MGAIALGGGNSVPIVNLQFAYDSACIQVHSVFYREVPTLVIIYVSAAVIATTALAVGRSRWIGPRSRRQAQAWARHAGHKIVRIERRSVFYSPFGFNASPLQAVHYLTVDENGNYRHAWLRCGQKFLGFGHTGIEVRWDK